MRNDSIKYPDSGLINLLRLDDEGLLEPYILLVRPHENFGEDYLSYREKNRGKIREFIVRYVLMTEK